MKRSSKFLVAALFCGSIGVLGAINFPNASMEEDYENDKIPDKWNIPESTQVKLVNGKISHGMKAARFDKGYVLLNCDMKAANLPGIKLGISFDAAGENGAALGVMLGYYSNVNGKVKFNYARLAWNRKLSKDYKKMRFNYVMPKNAVKDRIWFGVYRSSRKGTVWLDNFQMLSSRGEALTVEQKKQLVVLGREWGYLASRVKNALKRKPNSQVLRKIRDEVSDIWGRACSDDLEILKKKTILEKRLYELNALVNKVLAPDKTVAVWLGDAYMRLRHEQIIPANPKHKIKLLSLGNEYQAIGLTVANCSTSDSKQTIELTGLDKFTEKVEIRRQVFLKNWYDKERETVSDPLPRLPENNGKWNLRLNSGETVKLYIGFKVKKDVSGSYPVNIKLAQNLLKAEIKVLPRNLPRKPLLEHFQFIYPSIKPASTHCDINARHMAEHYVTGIEFPFLPKVAFDSKGNIVEEDFKSSPQALWMKTYTKYDIKLGLFWEGVYKRFPIAKGGKLVYLNKEKQFTQNWKRAYSQLLKSWLDFSRKEGVGIDKYLILTDDEVSSKAEFKTAPGSEVHNAVKLYQLTKKIEPKLKQFATLNDYASAKDYQAMLPNIDIAMPLWPFRTSLVRWAPEGYNPRKTFFKTILPMMKAERKKRGMQIWSYRIDCGKKEPVLNSGRAYPVCAVGLGFTGVSCWAYNVSFGLTWDDTDKGLVDYIYVYNGLENHPINKKYNPTKEVVVTSIRWEGFRMGMQDGQILLYLKYCMEKGKCDSKTADEIRALLKQADEYGRKLNYTFDGINKISLKIRELMLKVK